MAERIQRSATVHASMPSHTNSAFDQNLGRKVMVLFGNAGLARDFECIGLEDHSIDTIVKKVKTLKPNLVVIGPETFLALGLVDALECEGIATFGPKRHAALLESSKTFTKQICEDAKINSAEYKEFPDLDSAEAYVERYPFERSCA